MESLLARYKKIGAISTVSPALFIGESEPSVGILDASQQAGCRGVQKTPGDTAFTLIFLLARFVASDLVNPKMAHLIVK